MPRRYYIVAEALDPDGTVRPALPEDASFAGADIGRGSFAVMTTVEVPDARVLGIDLDPASLIGLDDAQFRAALPLEVLGTTDEGDLQGLAAALGVRYVPFAHMQMMTVGGI